MIASVVAARVAFGGDVWIYGAVTEGLRSVASDLPKVGAKSARRGRILFLSLRKSAGIPRARTNRRASRPLDGATGTTTRDLRRSHRDHPIPSASRVVGRIKMSLDRSSPSDLRVRNVRYTFARVGRVGGGLTTNLDFFVTIFTQELFERAKLTMHDDEHGVVHCVRTTAQPDKKGKELKKWREKKRLDLREATGAESSAHASSSWISYPGLFAGGGLDVMTALLLRRVLPTIEKKSKLRVLDYCSGTASSPRRFDAGRRNPNSISSTPTRWRSRRRRKPRRR